MVLVKNKLNIIETLLLSALSDFDISHKEFAKIIDEKVKYEEIKENIKNVKHEDLNKENDQTTSLENDVINKFKKYAYIINKRCR